MHPDTTILIVDDEPTNVDMLSQELDEEGYNLMTAYDGEEALIRVQEHQPDLILLDVMMPKVDGFTVCRILKGSGKTILIPVILLTALRGHEDRVRGIEAGADDFISKPFDRDELLAKIRVLLRQKRHRDEQEKLLKEQLQSTMKDLEQARLELARAQERIEMLERAKDQLSKFVPVSVRKMAETDPETFGFQKVETDATVLFLDIGGYSSMCETLDDEKVNFLVEKYFSEFLDDIRKGDGEINETAGDGLMIMFQKEELEEHARTAVSTAIAIHYKTLKVNAELRGKFEPTVVNMGINSGKVFLGATRFEGMSASRWTFTASGLTTVLAARIAGLATDGKILLGPETVNRLQEEFLIHPLGEHRLKNISKPVPVYQLMV
ncbi:MAG: response regulator [Desulfobacteraceae bacterium]|jgi:DNA-binding response OmpR family regulator